MSHKKSDGERIGDRSPLTFRMPAALHDAVKQSALAARRSLNSHICVLLEGALAGQVNREESQAVEELSYRAPPKEPSVRRVYELPAGLLKLVHEYGARHAHQSEVSAVRELLIAALDRPVPSPEWPSEQAYQPKRRGTCRGSAEGCRNSDNDGWPCIPGCPYAASAAPVDPRATFDIPQGFEAVRDAEGRATGTVQPMRRVKPEDTLIGRALARQRPAIAEREADMAVLKKTLSAMEARAYETGRKHAIEEMLGTNVAVIPKPAFQFEEQVEKCTGDYTARGEVRGIFPMKNGVIRFVVEHQAEGGGSFCHIYSEKNLRRVEA